MSKKPEFRMLAVPCKTDKATGKRKKVNGAKARECLVVWGTDLDGVYTPQPLSEEQAEGNEYKVSMEEALKLYRDGKVFLNFYKNDPDRFKKDDEDAEDEDDGDF